MSRSKIGWELDNGKYKLLVKIGADEESDGNDLSDSVVMANANKKSLFGTYISGNDAVNYYNRIYTFNEDQ
jgi:hypothetical protein